jgi:hypothetical protein
MNNRIGLPLTFGLVAACFMLAAGNNAWAQYQPGASAGRKPTTMRQPMPATEVVAASHGEIIGPQPGGSYGGGCSSGNCGGSCGSPCGMSNYGIPAGGNSLFWVRAEALAWWLDGYESSTALVTTSPAGTDRDDAGVLGRAGTSVLLSTNDFDDGTSPGGRYAIGTWINPCRDLGLELSVFHVQSDGTDFLANSGTASIIARPFFNVTDGLQDSELIVFPSVVTGSIQVHSDTEFYGAEVLLQKSLGGMSGCNVTGLFGYRYQQLNDNLQFTQATTSIDTASPIEPGTTFDLVDQFRTENEFHGAELGVLAEIARCNNVSFELLAKIAVGSTRSRAAINGSTRIVTPSGSDTTSDGALLALPSNSGTFEADEFSIVPEIALRMNYQIACNWQLQFGYTFIYWSDVARVGDQIDPRLNLSQLPPGPQAGDNLPAFNMVTDDFWAQGLNLGLQCDF